MGDASLAILYDSVCSAIWSMKLQLNIFVIHPSSVLTDHLPNGAGWIVYNYLRGLTERGHTVHVAVPRLEMREPPPPRMHLHPIKAVNGLLGRLHYIRQVRKLYRSLSRSVRFDLAQQFTPVDTGLSLALLGFDAPLVLGPYSGHWAPGADGPPVAVSLAARCKRPVRDSLAWLQQSQARALIVTCPAAIQRVISETMRQKRVHVVSHGVNTRDYYERNELPDQQTILFLANLEYRKGIFTLLDAFERVAPVVPGCKLEVWGSGAEEQAVRRRALESKFAERIHLRGRAPRERVSEIMRSPSVYCMPSHGEPYGMTLLEAMASGVPVVTTNVGGPPFIVHEEGGRVVPMRDAARLADALIEILSSHELQQSMGRYNRKRVEQEFDWSRSLDRMENVYEHVLGRHAGSSPEWAPASR